MEDPNQNISGENAGLANSKLERLQMRARRLQQQARQARERLREEETTQEKLARLLERRRIETEQRWLGGLAYIAGLATFRMRSSGPTIATSQPIDADLLLGAMHLLYEQLETLDDNDKLQHLRSSGQRLRKAYYENKGNPRCRILLPSIGAGTPKGDA